MRHQLAADSAAPSRARRMAEDFLNDEFLDEWAVSLTTRRNVGLVVSELVTNAVQHGSPPIALQLTLASGHLVIEVTDGGPPFSAISLPPSNAFGGRGLYIVEQLSLRWGSHAYRQGKTVWCDVDVLPPAPAR